MSSNLAVIEESIRSIQPVFESVAIDRDISFDRELEFAMQVMSSNDYLQKIALESPQSLIDAVTNLSAIGISLNPARKLAYLVPRKKKICLDISYMGLIEMALSTGSIRWAQAALVYEDDAFTLNGYDRAPTHTFAPFAKSRGALVGVYVVAKTADGDFLTETMTIDEVYAIRNRSEAWKAGGMNPWKSDEGEMVKKTVVKRASKYWPKTDRLDKAISYINTQGGEGIDFAAEGQGEQEPAAKVKPAVAMPQPRTDAVTDVEPRMQQEKSAPAAVAQQRAPSADLASPGEIAFITKKIAAKGWGIQHAQEVAGLDGTGSLNGLTRDGFIALKDAVK